MGKVYNDGITVGNGFEPTAAVPLDFRTVVKTHSDLDTVSSVYKGLSVFVEDEEKSYKYLGLDEDNNRIWEPDGGNGTKYLNVYQQEITVGAKTGVENIFISTNTDWTIQCDADWLYLSHTSGTNCAMVQVRYDYNETGQDRTATITVVANGQQNSIITFNQLKVLPISVNLSTGNELRITSDNNIRV